MKAGDARVEPLLSNLSKVLGHRRARRVPLARRSPMANTTATATRRARMVNPVPYALADLLMISNARVSFFLPAATFGLLALSALAAGCTRVPGVPAGGEPTSPTAEHTSRINMAELERRILSYADSLRSRADISPDAFGRAIGFTLAPVEGNSIKSQAKNLSVTEGYDYAASYFSVESTTDYPRHSIIFYQQGKPSVTDSPDGVCYWDAEEAGHALERLGYSGGMEAPFQRGGVRHYWRRGTEGTQELSTSLLTYPSDVTAGARTCVYEVRFGGADR